MEAAALAFVHAAFGPDPGTAHALMTPEAQDTVSRDNIVGVVGAATRQSGQYRDFKVVRTYVVDGTGGDRRGRAICGLLKNQQWVAVAVSADRRQAYVDISAATLNSDWSLIVWLIPTAEKWMVQWFHLGMSGLAGHSADVVLQLARREKVAGHAFNAYLLYLVVDQLVDRGDAFQLAIVQSVRGEVKDLKKPPEFEGQPPFTWKMKGKDYSVGLVSPTGVAGKLGLAFMLPVAKWTGNDAAAQGNREFLTAFVATHPEFSAAFNFLVARAMNPDGSGGFATVYEVGKGFL